MSAKLAVRRRGLIAVVVVAVALLSAGCGRKGPPEPPPGADYPRHYPSR
ncbi:MAG: lipoprotein [Rhodospirillales bacterium]|nr:lipoprotein [Rhodospirillales bacterium]